MERNAIEAMASDKRKMGEGLGEHQLLLVQ